MKALKLLGLLSLSVMLGACASLHWPHRNKGNADNKQMASAEPRIEVVDDAGVEATGLGREETLSAADDSSDVNSSSTTTIATNKPTSVKPVSASQQQKDARLNEQCKADLCFFFDFDKSELHRNAYNSLEAQARYLSSHPNLTMRLEGNTDERGSREYNLALGERRANAVAELLELQGARRSQLKVVSNGQEKPLALGHNNNAWSENRRVDLYICTANQPRCR